MASEHSGIMAPGERIAGDTLRAGFGERRTHTYKHAYIYTHRHMHTPAYPSTCVPTYTHAHVSTKAQACTRMYVHTSYIHAYVRAFKPTRLHAYTPTRIHNTRIHTYTHIHMHTCTHAHANIRTAVLAPLTIFYTTTHARARTHTFHAHAAPRTLNT